MSTAAPFRLLITAGPTHEPIDAVRFIGNRSSGRLGRQLADAAAARGWATTVLLGPTPLQPDDSRVALHRYTTTADLQALLEQHFPACDALIMAAAVADYRPKLAPGDLTGKTRRKSAGLVLHLEATPDLLAGCAAYRRAEQLLVGFALEPRAELEASAMRKLAKKRVDLVVGNPLETMESDEIEASVFAATDSGSPERRDTPGRMPKAAFAPWLLDVVWNAAQARAGSGAGNVRGHAAAAC